MERIDRLIKNLCNNSPLGSRESYTEKEIEYFHNKY